MRRLRDNRLRSPDPQVRAEVLCVDLPRLRVHHHHYAGVPLALVLGWMVHLVVLLISTGAGAAEKKLHATETMVLTQAEAKDELCGLGSYLGFRGAVAPAVAPRLTGGDRLAVEYRWKGLCAKYEDVFQRRLGDCCPPRDRAGYEALDRMLGDIHRAPREGRLRLCKQLEDEFGLTRYSECVELQPPPTPNAAQRAAQIEEERFGGPYRRIVELRDDIEEYVARQKRHNAGFAPSDREWTDPDLGEWETACRDARSLPNLEKRRRDQIDRVCAPIPLR